MGEHRHQVRGGRSGPTRPAQRLAVQSHRQQPALGGCLGRGQRGEIGAEAAVQIRRIQSLKYRSERLLGRSPKPDPQLGEHLDRRGSRPGREPGVGAHPRRGRQDRDRQQPIQRIPATARVAGVGHRSEHVEELRSQHLDAVPAAPSVQRLGNRRHG